MSKTRIVLGVVISVAALAGSAVSIGLGLEAGLSALQAGRFDEAILGLIGGASVAVLVGAGGLHLGAAVGTGGANATRRR